MNETAKSILTLVREQGGLNAKDLCQQLGISQSTVSRYINRLLDLRYIYIKTKDGKQHYYYRNKQAALAALKQEFAPGPSPIFPVTETTLAVKIDPRFYRVYETEFWECFYNEDFEGNNEIFAISFSGNVMYIHLWKEPTENETTDDEPPISVLRENVELISNFFNNE